MASKAGNRNQISSVETHPMRDKIIDRIMAGESTRSISASVTPYISHVAIHRYRQDRVKPALRNSSVLAKVLQEQELPNTSIPIVNTVIDVTRQSLHADPYIARIAKHQATVDAEVEAARGDAKGVAALIGADLRGLELQARLAGRLDAQPSVSVHIAMVSADPPPISDYGEVIDVSVEPA